MVLTLGTIAIYAAAALGLGTAGWLAGQATADIISELQRKGVDLEDSRTKSEWETKAKENGITNNNVTEVPITPSNEAINATPGAKAAVVEMGKQDNTVLTPNPGLTNGFTTDVSGIVTPFPGIGSAANGNINESRDPIVPSIGGNAVGNGETTGTTTPSTGNNNNNDDEDIPMLNESIPEIEDKTEDNLINSINPTTDLSEWKKWAEEQQKKQWEREDAIRKETQEREDSAYQRAVADMKKAGINPNLMNINPSESGGGITQATGMDMGTINKVLENASNQLVAVLEREFEGDENTKKELGDLIGTVISGLAMWFTFGK